MRTVTVTHEIYTFDELSDEAKEVVLRDIEYDVMGINPSDDSLIETIKANGYEFYKDGGMAIL